MKIQRKLLAAAMGVALLGTTAACGGDDEAAASGGTTPIKLSFEWTCEGNWPIAFVGEQQGFFSQNGVQVSYVRGQGGSSTTPLVAQGEQDMAVLSAPPVVLGAGQGLPYKVVGVAANESPVVILADGAIKTPQDLVGKKVAVQTDQFEGAVWEAFLAATGINASQVTVVPSDDAAQAQFMSKEIDAIVIFYPTPGTVALQDGREGEETVLKMQDYVPTYGHTIVANTKFLGDHADAVKGFLKGWAESTKYAVAHPDEALTLLQSKCPELDATTAKFTLDQYLAAYNSDYSKQNGYLAFDPAGLDATEKVLVAGKLMEETDLADYSTQEYLPNPPVKP